MELQCRSIVIFWEKTFLIPGDFTQRLHILARGAPFGIFQEKKILPKQWSEEVIRNKFILKRISIHSKTLIYYNYNKSVTPKINNITWNYSMKILNKN